MATILVAVFSVLVTFGFWGYNAAQIPELFRLNKELQAEGYYSAEFEFRMLGLGYMLDHGEYAKSMSMLSILHEKMKTREGFIKVPVFKSREKEMEFYRNLQNPATGAFMDDTYPYCTFEGPTGNVLEHLEELSKATGKPLKLKYPLKFLDSIATPERLKPYLDDMSHLGWIGKKLPESSFHFVRDLISYTKPDNVVERNHLYQFSPEWKRTLLTWFFENQDSITGYWGPRSRSSGELLKLDLHNTASIVKGFVDSTGRDLYAGFPLRYRERMFKTTLQVMNEPEPSISDEDKWHGWTLQRAKGIMLLTRYLWISANPEEKRRATTVFEDYIHVLFQKYWIPEEGGFRFYPDGRSSLDGTGTAIGVLKNLGYIPSSRRDLVSKDYATRILRTDINAISTLQASDLQALQQKEINSVRVYLQKPEPDSAEQNVQGIFYMRPTPVPDVMESVPKIRFWIQGSSLSMGNWISREETITDLAAVDFPPPKWIAHEIPLASLNRLLTEQGDLYLVGFNVFQIPVRIVHYHASQP